ncbi:hypothetical protein CHS0354_028903 [Potamilus streckersoni]|uniref:Mab-21-like HhH/H2TH-like domain-containing protein n=1 Tax=Potamilus streckersoni TaxID=2493646 RepID=A0AAE0SBL0_9BIVA|nr:hypothetical protein CHS0354_028903 [Potamilus streckersoni]
MMDDDIPEYFIDVSRQLSQCLRHICPIEESMRRRRELWAFYEALRSITDKYSSRCSAFLFGSQTEGSTTPGLQSDTDVALIYNKFIVRKETLEWDHRHIHCRLLTEGVPPGYVQLQCSERDHILVMAMTSTKRDVSLISQWQVEQMFCLQRNAEFALQLQLLLCSQDSIVDMCFAMQTKFREIELPHCLSRPRTNKKLLEVLESQEALDDHVNLKYESSPLSFEWKLYFCATERRLVAAFNRVQMECYILLKVLVKSFVQPHMGNVLSSYHLKTLMFHMIDSTEETTWNPNNLLLCTEMCLKRLNIYVVDGLLQDYFIPEINLFQDRVCGPVRFRLMVLLKQLLAEKGRFLLRIECDRIGDMLALLSEGKGISGNELVLNTYSFEITAIRTGRHLINTFLTHSCYNPFKLIKLLIHDHDHGSNFLKQAAFVLIGEVVKMLVTPQYMELWFPKLPLDSRKKITTVLLLIGAHSGNIVSSLKLAVINYIAEEAIKAMQPLELS